MELMGLTEIAEMLGVSRQRAGQLADSASFPAPADSLTAGRVWTRAAIENWARAKDRIG